MNKELIRTSITNSIYFSTASITILLLAGFLQELLKKTTGKLNTETTLIISFSLILIIFILSIANIFLKEPLKKNTKIKMLDRIIALIVFIVLSSLITIVIGYLFWIPS